MFLLVMHLTKTYGYTEDKSVVDRKGRFEDSFFPNLFCNCHKPNSNSISEKPWSLVQGRNAGGEGGSNSPGAG